VSTIRDVMGKSIEPTVLNEAGRDSEIPVQYLDSTRARTVLGWSPKYSFSDGLSRTIRWYEDLLRGGDRIRAAE
jgi:CDP-glucose 4,6-dehydratase